MRLAQSSARLDPFNIATIPDPDRILHGHQRFVRPNAGLALGKPKLVLHRNMLSASALPMFLLALRPSSSREAGHLGEALNLNVLAVCAVFVFVGAVLLGAF